MHSWVRIDATQIHTEQNDPNGMFVDADGVHHLYYQCDIDAHHTRGRSADFIGR